MAVNILVQIEGSTGGTSGATWVTVPDLTSTQTVAGTGSVLILTASASIAEDTDRGAEFQFYIDDVAVGPVAHAWSDNAADGTGSAEMHFAATGYTGSTKFEVKWTGYGNANGALDTTEATPYYFHVIEIEDNAEIIVDQSVNTAGLPPNTKANRTALMSASAVSVAGTGSKLLCLATVPCEYDATGGNDGQNRYQFGIDTTLIGGVSANWVDEVVGGYSASLIGATTGISASTHTFELYWWEVAGGGSKQHTTHDATFQVVEITDNATLHAEIDTTTAWSPGATDGNDSALDTDETISDASSVVLWGASYQIDTATHTVDHSIIYHMGLDDTSVGGVARDYQDTTSDLGGSSLMMADTMTAASHSFQLRGYYKTQAADIGTANNRHMFVLELTPGGAAARRIFNIS